METKKSYMNTLQTMYFFLKAFQSNSFLENANVWNMFGGHLFSNGSWLDHVNLTKNFIILHLPHIWVFVTGLGIRVWTIQLFEWW